MPDTDLTRSPTVPQTRPAAGRRGIAEAAGWQVWAALLIVYVVWGSTYLGIRVVIETMPPLIAGGIRFAICAVLMGLILAIRKGPGVLRVSRQEAMGALFIGALLLGVGNGGVMLAERDVPSGLTALIVGVVPLVVLLMRRSRGEHIERIQTVGVLGGALGLVILVAPLGLTGDIAPLGLVLLMISVTGWAYGSIASSHVALPRDPFVSTFYQFIAGSLVGFIGGALVGELAGLDPGTWSARSLVALGYLIVFGSLVAFTAYTWLLQHTHVSRAMTYAYVNPVVAVALGWAILGETITPWMLVGAALILASVALIVRLQRPMRTIPEPG
ncbi:MAG: EamA family transporter [Candidatus Limnocylindrales bacterium]